MYDLDEQTWDEVHGIKGPSYEDDEALARALAMESEWEDQLEVSTSWGGNGRTLGEGRNVGRARDSTTGPRRDVVGADWDPEVDEEMEVSIAVTAAE
jgi:hypothetical protein